MSDDEGDYEEQVEDLEDDELITEPPTEDLGIMEPKEEEELEDKILNDEIDEEDIIDELATDELIVEQEDKIHKKAEVKKINIIMGDKRKSPNTLTRFEYARVLSTRVIDIEKGEPIFIQTELTDPIEIAKEEVKQKKCPLTILRPVGNNTYELFKVSEF